MMNVRFSARAAVPMTEPASTSATNTWRIDQPPVSPEIGTRRQACVATLKPSLTGRRRSHAITNDVLAGFGPICLGHESHTAGLNCAGPPVRKPVPGAAVSPLSRSHDQARIGPLDGDPRASHSPPPGPALTKSAALAGALSAYESSLSRGAA